MLALGAKRHVIGENTQITLDLKGSRGRRRFGNTKRLHMEDSCGISVSRRQWIGDWYGKSEEPSLPMTDPYVW